jgi:hypothetical protein
MYEQVNTGPLYDEVVQWMSTFRSLTARMGGARRSTQVKLDRTLERLGERIDERLNELTAQELSALECLKDGILPGTYEMDREALMERPYCSIRLIHRWDEEYDVEERRQQIRDAKNSAKDPNSSGELRKFLNSLYNDDL